MKKNILFKCKKCKEKLKELERMLHSFNNKVAVISGVCEYVKNQKNLDARSKRLLGTATKACVYFSESKIEAEKRFAEILERIEEIEKGGVS